VNRFTDGIGIRHFVMAITSVIAAAEAALDRARRPPPNLNPTGLGVWQTIRWFRHTVLSRLRPLAGPLFLFWSAFD
jgi:hypothetical protein